MSKPHFTHTIIDTHCHIDFAEFDVDRDFIIQQAINLGVSELIVPSVAQSSWFKTIDVCTNYDHCHLALGLHPVFIEQHQPQHLVELDQLLNSCPAVAVGEIGLDFYLKNLDKNKQLAFFSKQLIIALQHQLPVIIHNRKAHDECINLLKEIGSTGGIIHAFNGSIQQAMHYIELGFMLGFGGMLTYDRSTKLKKLLEQIPLESIVLETDSPDMTVSQHQGQRNSPHYLPFVLQAVAKVKKVHEQRVASITTTNALRFTHHPKIRK